MSLLTPKASEAHTAITNVIINNKVIIYFICYPIIIFFNAKLQLFAHTGKIFLTKWAELCKFLDMNQIYRDSFS